MEEWEKYLDEGLAYAKVAIGAKEKGKLGNTVLYNTVSLSIEGFMTGILVREGIFPEHSSISGMLREIKKLMPVPEEFTSEVRFLNSFMNFCSLEIVPERIPTDEEIERMVNFLAAFSEWAGQRTKVA